jgi:hypothetical protein
MKHTSSPSDRSSEHYFVSLTSEPQTKPNVTRILHGIYGDTED